MALPIGAAEPLVRGLQPGARLNVLASLPDTDSGRPLSAVVTRGATIVQSVTSSDPLVVEVSPDDALVLAHLVLGGTQLSYAVWPGGVEPAETPPLDERTVRALLGLQLPATPTLEPTLAPPATATPVPPRRPRFGRRPRRRPFRRPSRPARWPIATSCSRATASSASRTS